MIARLACGLAVFAALAASPRADAADASFARFLDGLWPAARALGVSRPTFEAATRDLEPDLSLPDLDLPGRAVPRGQAEFVLTPSAYLKESSLEALAARGRRLRDEHRATLDAIARRFGVPPAIVLAIWGRETAFGSHRLTHHAIKVLATLAYAGRRKDFFRQEFLLALKMIDKDHIRVSDMRSSWAGAMGQTQFLPSEFFKYAVDMDGDGRRDIWHSVPDTLASAAKQLQGKGWQPGKTWAIEVRVPASFDCSQAEPGVTRPIGDWLGQGFTLLDGAAKPHDSTDAASVLMPEGRHGPAFLTLRNYYVLKDYNFSDLYVLFVGTLADRIDGGRGFRSAWGKSRQLTSAAVEAMQRHLERLGLYGDSIDGKAGMKTRAAVGAYQKANGLPLDCWPSDAVLAHMRR